MSPYIVPGLRNSEAQKIITAVCEYLEVPVKRVSSKARFANLVLARHVSMYLIRNLRMHSLAEIGEMFGGRDHTTVIHALSSVSNRLAYDENFGKMMDELNIITAQALSEKEQPHQIY